MLLVTLTSQVELCGRLTLQSCTIALLRVVVLLLLAIAQYANGVFAEDVAQTTPYCRRSNSVPAEHRKS